MVTIPYARSAPYDNSDYVTRMADLMLRRGDVVADSIRRSGDARAQQWSNAGGVVMSTLAQMGAARDAERARAIALQQQQFENNLKLRDAALRQQEINDARDSREADRQWREAQFHDASARNSADDLAPGTAVAPDDYRREFAGTSAARRFEHRDAEDARLPARSTTEGALVPGYRTSNPEDEYVADPMRASISPDVASRPDRFVRVPNWQERTQAEELDMRRRSNEIAQQNTLADNRRADEAARATQSYREARLRQGNRDRQPTTATLALAAAKGDPEAQKALDIIRRAEGGRSPQQIQNFMTLSGQYQKSPLVAASDRTVVLADAIKAIQEDPSNPTAQLNLAYSYVQALDTYQSAVREGELQNISQLATKFDQLRVSANRIASTGAFMPAGLATDIARTSQRMIAAIQQAKQAKAADFGKRARVAGVGDMWDAYQLDGNAPAPAAPGVNNWFAENAPGKKKP